MTTATQHPSLQCPTCQNHLTRRFRALIDEVVRLAVTHKIDAPDLLRRHMRAIHHRHQAGYSLALNAGPTTREHPMPG